MGLAPDPALRGKTLMLSRGNNSGGQDRFKVFRAVSSDLPELSQLSSQVSSN